MCTWPQSSKITKQNKKLKPKLQAKTRIILLSFPSLPDAALCPCPGATHPQGDQPGDGHPDQGSCSFTEGHCSRRSNHAPGRHAPQG
uniref:Uncharacterized protein n=1 Tax=Ailuropoda melanoleuca TaxID=9646 RepID=A0A7N5K3N9_AILME